MTADERRAWLWQGIPDDAEDGLVWLLLRWRMDPIAFAVECLRIILAPYQAQILLDLADAPAELYAFYGLDPAYPKRQLLIPSGHGLGKTRVVAVAIWWHLITHRFSKTLCTAPTSDQLTQQLWGEVRKLFRRMKKHWPDIANEWEVLSSSIVHKDPDFGDWYCVGRTARADKPEGVQGAHALDDDDAFGDIAAIFGDDTDLAPSGGMMVVTEEASGVPDEVRETLEGALSEEGARFLAPGNPTRADGWFADAIAKPGTRYAVHNLDCRMSDRSKVYQLPYRLMNGDIRNIRVRGFVQPAYWENIIAECDGDEDADRVRVRVRGLPPRSNLQQCIKTHWIEQAQAREPDRDSIREPVIISLDFGLFSDKHGIAVRQGYNIRDLDEWLPPDRPEDITLEAARKAIDAQAAYGARYIIGDANGVGRGAMEYLSNHYRERPELKVTVVHFNSGRASMDRRYPRLRDEMWYKQGRGFFSDPRVSMPVYPGVRQQLTDPGYFENDRKEIKLETKADVLKRTGHPSGNLADAILQSLMVHVVADKPKPAEPEFKIPELFQGHFRRWRARQDAQQGASIR